jgi:hypothetical protein
MWIIVRSYPSGAVITNATFSVAAYNQGDGWYYMYIPMGYDFLVSAPGHYSVGGNTDSWDWMWANLGVLPPTTTYGCSWSG